MSSRSASATASSQRGFADAVGQHRQVHAAVTQTGIDVRALEFAVGADRLDVAIR
jgi:hypothetical protein